MTARVLVYGPGSGLGKSTIARHLQTLLAASGATVHLVREEDVAGMTAFRPYVEATRAGRGADPDLLLACVDALARTVRASRETWVLDSVLPGFDWLATAGSSDAQLLAFADAVAVRLAPLRPVLIHVTGDVHVALARAIADRGDDWAERLAERRTGARKRGALAAYFERLQATTIELLTRWPSEVIRLDATGTDETTMLRQLDDRFAAA